MRSKEARPSLGLLVAGACLVATMAVAGCEAIAGLGGDFHAATSNPSSSGSGGSSTHASSSSSGGHGGAGGTGGGVTDAGDAGDASDASDATDGAEPDGGDGGDASDGAGGACVGKTYPDPPVGNDSPGGAEFTVAIHSIDLGESGTNPGYDLDHRCTCTGNEGPTCTSSLQHCDEPQGVDNGMLGFVKLVQFAVPSFASDKLSSRADQGYWTMLARVKGYNGLPDDPSVTVEFFTTDGLDFSGLDAAARPAPLWDGTDHWEVLSDSVGDAGTDSPRYVAPGAYVAGGVLVAAIPSVALLVSGQSGSQVPLKLTNAVITGTLVPKNGTYGVTGGTVAGRVAVPDMFHILAGLRDPAGNPICTNSLGYTQVKQSVCDGRDILLDGNLPKTFPCDSISVGIGYTADPANLGKLVDPPVATAGCPAADDPANDTCP